MRFLFVWGSMKKVAMKSILKNLIVGVGLLVLFTYTANAQWVQSNETDSMEVSCLEVSGNTIFAGSNKNAFISGSVGGVFFSTDSGTGWTAAGLPLAIGSIHSLAASGTTIIVGTDSGVFVSYGNYNHNWIAYDGQLASGLWNYNSEGSKVYTTVSSLALIGTTIIAGTWKGLYISTSNQNNWTALPNYGWVLSFAVSGSNIFGGTWGNGIIVSSDTGTTWTAVNSGLTNDTVYTFAVSGSNIFAGTDGGGVFLSVNNGTSWRAVNSGLTNTVVRSLAVGDSIIIAGTLNGVFLSANNGTSWTAFNFGLTNLMVSSLVVSGNNIFAGTSTGVWRRPLSDMVGVINDKSHQGMSK